MTKRSLAMAFIVIACALVFFTGQAVAFNGLPFDEEVYAGDQAYDQPTRRVTEKIHYVVEGDYERVRLVANRMTSLGYDVEMAPGESVSGKRGRRDLPGVTVASSPGEGIFIPVTERALRRGLCDDQDAQISSLPKCRERLVRTERQQVRYTRERVVQRVVVPQPYPVYVPQYVPFPVQEFQQSAFFPAPMSVNVYRNVNRNVYRNVYRKDVRIRNTHINKVQPYHPRYPHYGAPRHPHGKAYHRW